MRLKSPLELELSRQDSFDKWTDRDRLDRSRLLLIYARQSSNKQFVYNVQSALQQTEDAIERAKMLGWTQPYDPNQPDNIAGRYLVLVENAVAKKCSGTLPIDSRPGLSSIIDDYIETRKASAVLVVAVDRLFRDEDGIDSAVFCKACRVAKCVVITPDRIYDFPKDYSYAKREFVREAEIGADFIKYHIRKRMLGNRTRKVEKGNLVGNGVAPIGLRVQDGQLVPTSHADAVNWLHTRYQELDASRSALLKELTAMARRGEPLFPIADDVDHTFLTEVPNADGELLGWTISSLFGLSHVLGNPAYQGHLVWIEQVLDEEYRPIPDEYRMIVKRDVFPQAKIVDETAWQFAFQHLADFDLDGQPIERGKRTVRYSQEASTPNTALLAGVRHDGRAVVEGTEGMRVYVSLAINSPSVYKIRRFDNLGQMDFEAAISVTELDRVLENRLNARLLSGEFLQYCDGSTPDTAIVGIVHEIYDEDIAIVDMSQPKPDDTLEEINSEIARLQHDLDIAKGVMDDETRIAKYAKIARLKQRRQKAEETSKQAVILANEQAQAKDDIVLASEQYQSWDIERKRRLWRIVTDSITLESLADGWKRVTLHWSALVGYGSEQAYIWSDSGSRWSEDELAILRSGFGTSTAKALLAELPNRSWASIQGKATAIGVKRGWAIVNDRDIPRDTSMNDLAVIQKYGIEPGKPVQWVSNASGSGTEQLKK